MTKTCREAIDPALFHNVGMHSYVRYVSMPVRGYQDRRSFGVSSLSTLVALDALNPSCAPRSRTAQGHRAAGELAVKRSSGLEISKQGEM